MMEAYVQNNDEIMAKELQYYLNCNTCSKTVEFIRTSPNDKLLIDLIIYASVGSCYEFAGKELCDKLAIQSQQIITEAFFGLFIT